MPSLTVRIDDRLHNDMKLVAALQGKTMNELYVDAMEKLVEANNVFALRKACSLARTKDASGLAATKSGKGEGYGSKPK